MGELKPITSHNGWYDQTSCTGEENIRTKHEFQNSTEILFWVFIFIKFADVAVSPLRGKGVYENVP